MLSGIGNCGFDVRRSLLRRFKASVPQKVSWLGPEYRVKQPPKRIESQARSINPMCHLGVPSPCTRNSKIHQLETPFTSENTENKEQQENKEKATKKNKYQQRLTILYKTQSNPNRSPVSDPRSLRLPPAQQRPRKAPGPWDPGRASRRGANAGSMKAWRVQGEGSGDGNMAKMDHQNLWRFGFCFFLIDMFKAKCFDLDLL